ncbi:MAG: 30S ribosomal protein S9 [Ignavibacteriaceae bacterium]|nr:30S ribosomal protein S9 [Ignavibacteriaceae bacterium]NUM69247.1 30S ribosomal protein S9 [Ignavibacteriaceae bacterium]
MSDTVIVGRRKTAVARVVLRAGNGKFTVNGRALEEAFPMKIHQDDIKNPFLVAEVEGKYDVLVNVRGGGISGQAEAIRLAISKALSGENAELRPALKKEGFLRRDPRMVERKKYGRPKARKRFQFSKR